MTPMRTRIKIRDEVPADHAVIHSLVGRAFSVASHASGDEAEIVKRLRDRRALTLSVVAEEDGKLLGHCVLSPVQIGGSDLKWLGLGPVAVLPECQGEGIGAALIERCLVQAAQFGARGVVVLGDPGYYKRFGFDVRAGLIYPDAPAEYFMALKLRGDWPRGVVTYDSAFG